MRALSESERDDRETAGYEPFKQRLFALTSLGRPSFFSPKLAPSGDKPHVGRVRVTLHTTCVKSLYKYYRGHKRVFPQTPPPARDALDVQGYLAQKKTPTPLGPP